MKELESKDRISIKEQLEQVVTKQQAVELKYIDSIIPKKGHTLFEINVETLECKPAEYQEKKTISWSEAIAISKGTFKSEVVIKQKCVYISALNKESALERYKLGKGSSEIKGSGFKL